MLSVHLSMRVCNKGKLTEFVSIRKEHKQLSRLKISTESDPYPSDICLFCNKEDFDTALDSSACKECSSLPTSEI